MKHADDYYRHKDGTPTGEPRNLRHALRFLIRKHGQCRVKEFGPIKLKEVRAEMLKDDLYRTSINKAVHRIKRVFAWGVEEEIVPAMIYQALRAVKSLKAGRTEAREPIPVKPVDQGTVDETLRHLSNVVGDMVRLQLLCGMRPGEVCSLRPCDVSRGIEGVWTYRPAQHKTEHLGRDRRIPIGPEGQKILAKYFDCDPESFCFSPVESEIERNTKRKRSRRSALTPSQLARKAKGRAVGHRYTKDSYNRAVQRDCEQAFGMPPELREVIRFVRRQTELSKEQREDMKAAMHAEAAAWRLKYCWSPNQLRHSRATELRERYGIEVAQNVLGHSDPRTTAIYAERDFATAVRIMQEIG